MSESKNEIMDHFSAILDEMIDNSNYFKAFFLKPFELNSDDCFHTSNNISVSIASGATRVCIIDYDYDYVIKFSYEFDETEEDCCDRELALYERAVKKNIADCFCQPIDLGYYCKAFEFYDDIDASDTTISGFDELLVEYAKEFSPMRPISVQLHLYAYPRASFICTSTFIDNASSKDRKVLKRYESPLLNNLSIGYSFLRDYEEEHFAILNQFCLDNHINDIHLANVGTIGGKIKLIDFAGYHNWLCHNSDYF